MSWEPDLHRREVRERWIQDMRRRDTETSLRSQVSGLSLTSPPTTVALMPDITIDSIAHGGEGVGRIDGKAHFVAGVMPGERVEIEVVREKRRWARGEARPGRRGVARPSRGPVPCVRDLRRMYLAVRRIRAPARVEARRRRRSTRTSGSARRCRRPAHHGPRITVRLPQPDGLRRLGWPSGTSRTRIEPSGRPQRLPTPDAESRGTLRCARRSHRCAQGRAPNRSQHRRQPHPPRGPRSGPGLEVGRVGGCSVVRRPPHAPRAGHGSKRRSTGCDSASRPPRSSRSTRRAPRCSSHSWPTRPA